MSNEQGEKQKKYYVLHVPGGGLWGVLPIVTLKFLERMTLLPLSRQFNMSSGSSTGSIALSAMNIPKSQDGREPRYTASDILEFYKTIGPRIFPHRRAYYPRQMAMDLTKLGHDFMTGAIALLAARMDILVNYGINSLGHKLHNRYSRKKAPYRPWNTRLFRLCHRWFFTPLNNLVGRGIVRMIEKSRYDISVLAHILDTTMRYEDTNRRVKFGDTLISHHVTAHNLTRDEPAIFFNFLDPETGRPNFTSDPDMDIDQIVLGSCAAQTIFRSPTLRNGETYVDIADFDTMRTPISSLDRHADQKLDIKLVMIGTGASERQIDVDSMNGMLFLQQMISDLGGYLFGIRKRYINKVADMDLEHRLGRENITRINIPAARESLNPDYINDPRIADIARIMDVDLDNLAATELPSRDLFDSRPENMRRLESLGWIMTFKNLDVLMPLCRDLVMNAQSLGHISEDEAKQRINLIDHFNQASIHTLPKEDILHLHTPEEKRHPYWLVFEETRPRSFCNKIAYIFKRAVGRTPTPVQPPPTPAPDIAHGTDPEKDSPRPQ